MIAHTWPESQVLDTAALFHQIMSILIDQVCGFVGDLAGLRPKRCMAFRVHVCGDLHVFSRMLPHGSTRKVSPEQIDNSLHVFVNDAP